MCDHNWSDWEQYSEDEYKVYYRRYCTRCHMWDYKDVEKIRQHILKKSLYD